LKPLKAQNSFLYLRRNKEQEFKMKKFLVPVTFMMSTYVEVEAEDIEEAIHEAAGVDISIDSADSWEYVGDSWEVDEEGIEEVPQTFKAGQVVRWTDPDDDICSGTVTFVGYHGDGCASVTKDGVEMECFVDELS
tara:strand:+ start:170 stop:574 length:405 start_codon:yes stop_codon:yes gene_type:complete